jgi:RNA polymerase sigma-70 factor, ECF subfamily
MLASRFAGQLGTVSVAMVWESGTPATTSMESLERVRALDRFLLEIEKRAYRIARIAVRQDDDALDIVQDAMLQLARRYGQRASEEWRPLFFRILQNRIRDCLRRRKIRAKFTAWLPGHADEGEAGDPYELVPDRGPEPMQHLATDQAMRRLEGALAELPARQQEAFMLRNFEGLDVAATARAMSCSEGSVKTHYSRAVHTLRERLGDVW